MSEGSRDKDLIGVEEVARRLGLVPATVWRWCREGRLPCIKMGKSWRIRPEALEDFIRRSERPATLEGELGSFLRVPDNVLAVAQSPELSHRLDAAFLKVAEARDGLLVKFYGDEVTDEDELRERLEKGVWMSGAWREKAAFTSSERSETLRWSGWRGYADSSPTKRMRALPYGSASTGPNGQIQRRRCANSRP